MKSNQMTELVLWFKNLNVSKFLELLIELRLILRSIIVFKSNKEVRSWIYN
jgi:hypothetical protein